LNFLLHFIFIAVFLFLFVVSLIILKPFRIHKKRPYSTISLKLSYLIYLLSFLVLAYLLLFFSRIRGEVEENSINDFTIYYIIIIVAFLLPNIGIMLRRKVKRLRTQYNVIFTAINLGITFILIFLVLTVLKDF